MLFRSQVSQVVEDQAPPKLIYDPKHPMADSNGYVAMPNVNPVEPMVNAGKPQTKQLPDGWTVVTKDHSLSAQWEHTIAVTDDGFEILTPWPDAA